MTREGMIKLAKAMHADGWKTGEIAAQLQADGETIARLEAALDPFVKYIIERNKVVRHAPDETIGDFWREGHRSAILLVDLERARAALRPADKGDAP